MGLDPGTPNIKPHTRTRTRTRTRTPAHPHTRTHRRVAEIAYAGICTVDTHRWYVGCCPVVAVEVDGVKPRSDWVIHQRERLVCCYDR